MLKGAVILCLLSLTVAGPLHRAEEHRCLSRSDSALQKGGFLTSTFSLLNPYFLQLFMSLFTTTTAITMATPNAASG
ncbi:unnamed protein product [Knipowitschia caucasica]